LVFRGLQQAPVFCFTQPGLCPLPFALWRSHPAFCFRFTPTFLLFQAIAWPPGFCCSPDRLFNLTGPGPCLWQAKRAHPALPGHPALLYQRGQPAFLRAAAKVSRAVDQDLGGKSF
jgi:hypothetical protein